MGRNIGDVDRILRTVLGLALLSLFVVLPGAWRLLGLIALVPLGTALAGWCPLYSLIGITTCRDGNRPRQRPERGRPSGARDALAASRSDRSGPGRRAMTIDDAGHVPHPRSCRGVEALFAPPDDWTRPSSTVLSGRPRLPADRPRREAHPDGEPSAEDRNRHDDGFDAADRSGTPVGDVD